MPELPEVEMVARNLRTLLAGMVFTRAELLREGLAPYNSRRQFSTALRRTRLESVGRSGKHLLLHFDNGRTLIVHLRMTGRFVLLREEASPPPHTHALFVLADGRKLAFADQRHFGFMQVVRTAEMSSVNALARLAPEPLGPDFTPGYLSQTLARSRQAVKLLLLDQSKVLGLGNIYASEALFRARIDPRLRANLISRVRARRLHGEIGAVLEEAIANNSFGNPDPENLSGSYGGGLVEGMTRVYDREGLGCPDCGISIRRIVQGARSTFFCPSCQRR